LIQNNICKDDLPKEIEKIAVANIDVDMYEPTLVALNKVSDLVVKGGVVIVEDATSTPCLYGAYLAMEEFLEFSKPYVRKKGQKESGSGLGLNICTLILKEHGFTISCEKTDNGTKLSIKL